MIFDQVTDREMQAARILGGATMAVFLAAPIFGRQARTIRVVAAGIYIAVALAVSAYLLL
jgi:hypothetical protein